MKSFALNHFGPSSGASLSQLFAGFFSQNAHPEYFYLTGFEGLCVEESHAQVCEAVISSLIPFDGELLILGSETSDACNLWRTIGRKLDINVSFLDADDADLLAAIETVFESNRHITHVLCSSERDGEMLKAIGGVVRRARKSLIVDNCTDSVTMANIDKSNIDFLITASDDLKENPVSLIIARRSKLVQAEGIARRADHDIYALWQQNMNERRSTLEPMS